MKTLIRPKKRTAVKNDKEQKSFRDLTFHEKERTAFILVDKHFQRHDNIQRATKLSRDIFKLIKDEVFYLKGKFYLPQNLSEILNY
jgi:hypothetical protein